MKLKDLKDIQDSGFKIPTEYLEEFEDSILKLASLKEKVSDSGFSIPEGYFDIVYSIYAFGWTVDLVHSLKMVSKYLKSGGIFVFSWDHPLLACLETKGKDMIISKPYHENNIIKLNIFSWKYIQRNIINQKSRGSYLLLSSNIKTMRKKMSLNLVALK